MDAPAILHRNNVRIRGEGRRVLLFAHGFGCDQSMWRHVAPAFEAGWRVACFDHVGAGRSDRAAYDSRHGSLEGYAQDVIGICEALGGDPVCFVGHSVGAMIGVLAALRAPQRFERLVLVAPSPCYLDDPPHYRGGFARTDLEGLLELMDRNHLGWASFLAATVMQNPERPELAEELRESFCALDPLITREFARVTFLSDHRALLPELRTPALIMQCAQDMVVPAEVGEYLHRQLRGSTLVRMRATGHCPHVSHPQETRAVIADYLAQAAA
ncbi:alpha/beta fold hydrolase [Caldimonas tepidiphila]|uniref:alpha/beta fold hydrolase n=1 Tax=Caldimonas tepidiphila TaxID=2315841 RepID=UPI000E5B1FE1|nr:alpha/beta hydrolase [Caldimonas tepidiphila]